MCKCDDDINYRSKFAAPVMCQKVSGCIAWMIFRWNYTGYLFICKANFDGVAVAIARKSNTADGQIDK